VLLHHRLKSHSRKHYSATINTRQAAPDFSGKFNPTPGKAQHKTVNYAMSDTFGFGKQIASTIFKKFMD
jgi:3-oxoacyl-[acyl-carrier-protein] synthase II